MKTASLVLAALIAASPPANACDHSRQAPSESEALALTAIEGLMAAPPERAVGLLKKVLAGAQTPLVKQRALFVLAQFDRADASALLIETARSGPPALKCEAIRSIGIGGQSAALAVLPTLYASGDAAVRAQVLEALLIAGRPGEVLQIATAASSEAERLQATRTLAAMGATTELRKLSENPRGAPASRGLVEAFALSGDLDSLRKLASGNEPLATRQDAAQRMGIIGSEAAKLALRQLYSTASEPALREATLKGLQIANDQAGVLALYRAAGSPEERRALLRLLSLMGGDAALDAIDAALKAPPAPTKK